MWANEEVSAGVWEGVECTSTPLEVSAFIGTSGCGSWEVHRDRSE